VHFRESGNFEETKNSLRGRGGGRFATVHKKSRKVEIKHGKLGQHEEEGGRNDFPVRCSFRKALEKSKLFGSAIVVQISQFLFWTIARSLN
jgi:hypothetical protein